jgi:putative transcriptional regulator
MKTVRMKVDLQSFNAKPVGRVDVKRVDATTEADIADHQAEDDSNAMLDSAKFARRVAGEEALERMAENARELGLDY